MKVHPTISMKTKSEKKEVWESPTMLLKIMMLYILSEDVDENKWTY